jgi:hypothetical protein
MKRFVYVPPSLANDELALKEAEKLAKDAQLSLRIGSIGDGINKYSISIIAIPEFSATNHDEVVKSNFIFSADITNEFVSMDKSIQMETISPTGLKQSFYPTVLERHVAKFRVRFAETGKYEFSVCDKDTKFLVSSFEVI